MSRAPTRGAITLALEQARAHGFLGPGPIEPQIEHAEGFAGAVGPAPALAVDLGSGGGLPGLVLAAVWPHCRLLLVEAQQRRSQFLERVVLELRLDQRVTVIGQRAEEAARAWRYQADAVVARGFGPPAVTSECAAPFLRVGGVLAVSEPPTPDATRWPEDGLRQLGLHFVRRVAQGATYACCAQVEPCPERFPRRVGIPMKRPLF